MVKVLVTGASGGIGRAIALACAKEGYEVVAHYNNGKEKAEASKKLDFSCPLRMEEVDEKCRNCPLIGNCPTCYGINYSACGNVYHITDDCCRMMKVQFLANAMFQYQQYRLGRKEFKSEEAELKFLRNVKAVQELKL